MLGAASKHRVQAQAEKRGHHGKENNFQHFINPICEQGVRAG
jgi:hypothetical protein